jgi:hypothetical protein
MGCRQGRRRRCLTPCRRAASPCRWACRRSPACGRRWPAHERPGTHPRGPSTSCTRAPPHKHGRQTGLARARDAREALRIFGEGSSGARKHSRVCRPLEVLCITFSTTLSVSRCQIDHRSSHPPLKRLTGQAKLRFNEAGRGLRLWSSSGLRGGLAASYVTASLLADRDLVWQELTE